MLPKEVAYERHRGQNIFFNDREDLSLFLSSREKAKKRTNQRELREKDRVLKMKSKTLETEKET